MQEALKQDYQSAPLNESSHSKHVPYYVVPGHKRINTASLDFYLSNPKSIPEETKRKFQEEEKVDKHMDAREIKLFSRNRKKRSVAKKWTLATNFIKFQYLFHFNF